MFTGYLVGSAIQHTPTLMDKLKLLNKTPQTKSLFLSAGHSGTDSGAVGKDKGGVQYTEADIVLELRDMIATELLSLGVTFTTDGLVGNNLPLKDAVQMAKQHDLSLELHCNAFVNPSAGGCEALCDSGKGVVASKVVNACVDVLGIPNRGVKGEASGQHSRLAFISQANGIILELFFISNPNELELYKGRKHLLAKRLAEALRDIVTE